MGGRRPTPRPGLWLLAEADGATTPGPDRQSWRHRRVRTWLSRGRTLPRRVSHGRADDGRGPFEGT